MTTSNEPQQTELLAEVSWTSGEIKLRVYTKDEGKTVMVMDERDSMFNSIMQTLGLEQWISLLRMEHDLMDDCVCATCYQAEQIRRIYEAP